MLMLSKGSDFFKLVIEVTVAIQMLTKFPGDYNGNSVRSTAEMNSRHVSLLSLCLVVVFSCLLFPDCQQD